MKTLDIDITTVPFGYIVHFVNCKGTWGAGLAAQLKQKYPEAFRQYKEHLETHYKGEEFLALGDAIFCPIEKGNKTIISCFTQYDTGVTSRKTEYSAVFQCLKQFGTLGNNSVYIPHGVGCGLGGGDWNIVSKIIEKLVPRAIICKHG
jgi:O-acetyl-ADP-ribose deacetylase (regulator of RNase III)